MPGGVRVVHVTPSIDVITVEYRVSVEPTATHIDPFQATRLIYLLAPVYVTRAVHVTASVDVYNTPPVLPFGPTATHRLPFQARPLI